MTNCYPLRTEGHIYSRMTNPTTQVFEKRVALLEGGVEAVATSSGQSAQLLVLLNIAGTGDNIVSSSFLHGGTYNQFKVTFKKFGIDIHWVTKNDPVTFVKVVDGKTKAIYVESIANPKYSLSDIAALSKVAHDAGIPLIVDNTFGMGGYLIRPIEHGADIVVHSATKWIGGHGTTIAGVVIDGRTFNWAASGKFPGITQPSEGYHGLKFLETYSKSAYGAKLRHELLRDLGPSINPFASFLLLLGLETLSLRAQRHSENALVLAKYFEQHPQISWLTEEEQRKAGFTPDLIRVSAGVEAIGDIIADFKNALGVVAAEAQPSVARELLLKF
ncbi:hypothetical protein C0995_000986 [Termitomyces sp. Mi166|nr:hypothetical protein C0995_000986 [Termitomyces sp. Mi166\